jgi:hypothetical protein
MRRWGTLARVSIGGGVAPREVLADVWWADWAPDGQSLAIVREVGSNIRLEYPMGNVLQDNPFPGWISHPRVSQDGKQVAYVDHPSLSDEGGVVVIADRSGKKTRLTDSFTSLLGLAWSPRGEIFFTATSPAESAGGTYNRALYSVKPGDEVRRRAAIAGCLTLHDISRDGRMLVSRDAVRGENVARGPGASEERDLTWFDWSIPGDLSSDGTLFLFTGPCGTPKAAPGAPQECVYLRKTDGSPPVRLGNGRAGGLSPDGKWALAILDMTTSPRIVAYPTGPGDPKFFPGDGLNADRLIWLPDGKSFMFMAKEPGGKDRMFVRDFDGGKPRPVTPEDTAAWLVTPDGKWTFGGGGGTPYFYPIDGGPPRDVGRLAKERLIRFGMDGSTAYVGGPREIPRSVYRLDLVTGERRLLWSLKPAELAGVLDLLAIKLTPDGKSYVYHFQRFLSDLYLLEGID